MALYSLYCAEVPLRNCSPKGSKPASLRRGTVGVDLVHPVMIHFPTCCCDPLWLYSVSLIFSTCCHTVHTRRRNRTDTFCQLSATRPTVNHRFSRWAWQSIYRHALLLSSLIATWTTFSAERNSRMPSHRATSGNPRMPSHGATWAFWRWLYTTGQLEGKLDHRDTCWSCF